MKFKEILESTTSGSVATVSTPMGGTQTRGKGIYPNQKGGNLLTGKKTNKKYANSLKESATVSEAELQEDDLILVPGQGHKLKTGFIPHGASRIDHEVEMARSDLFQAVKNARAVHDMLKDRSEDEGLEGWVQEKIIKANDYLNSVREYLEGKKMQEMTGGVIAGGGVGEGDMSGLMHAARNLNKSFIVTAKTAEGDTKKFRVKAQSENVAKEKFSKHHSMAEILDIKEEDLKEGAKVDRMVKHIKKSEMKAGKSAGEAEDIAWATANKRGMLDNKNKKKNESIDVTEGKCPECGGPAFSEEHIAEAKDACYHKVKSRYKVWPSAYASGALVKCRKVGASNWGNKSKK